MEAAASQTVDASALDTTLPLRFRLRRAFLIALLLGLWAPVKIGWEEHIAHQQDLLRYNGATVSIALRDQLSQGLTIGVLAGMRSVVSDFVWLEVTAAWMTQDWWKMGTYINACTSLQPRAPMFWDMGGWQLAWNASSFSEKDVVKYPSELQRQKVGRYWIERGLDIYVRGLQNNPNYWRLWFSTALLYDQRLRDYKSAAYYYEQASEKPNAPIYLERDPAHMYDRAHLDQPVQEYAEWVKLWRRLTPVDMTNSMHTAPHIALRIRQLEDQLAIPNEKRVFPK